MYEDDGVFGNWAECDDEYPLESLEEPPENMTDVEADADTLASAGMGTDEDYGYYGSNPDRESYDMDDRDRA